MKPARAVSVAFEEAFGRPPVTMWAAPGRVNLIGEHTDYNDGFVLPLALPVGVVGAAGPRADGRVVVRSVQRPGDEVGVEVARLAPGDVGGWGAYPVGVAWALHRAGHAMPGADVLVDADVPAGAGLASSAALTCAVASALLDVAGLDLDRSSVARLARTAENDFVGAPTGVMDQLASLHGRAGHAIFIDTRTLAVTPVPLDLEASGLALLVVDTDVRHELVDGAYAARRSECEQAARLLGVSALRDVAEAAADGAAWAELPERVGRRARHVLREDARVLRCVELLSDGGDLRRIGPLLTASHRSLRDDFEVSTLELDVAVDAALAAGAHGARMTGGGFGGCAIALVERTAVDRVTSAVGAAFATRGLTAPSAFVAVPSPGARRLASD